MKMIGCRSNKSHVMTGRSDLAQKKIYSVIQASKAHMQLTRGRIFQLHLCLEFS